MIQTAAQNQDERSNQTARDHRETPAEPHPRTLPSPRHPSLLAARRGGGAGVAGGSDAAPTRRKQGAA